MALLGATLSPNSLGEGTSNATFSLSNETNATRGGSVSIEVSFSSSQDIKEINVSLSYDDTVLSYVDQTNSIENSTGTSGSFSLSYETNTAVSGTLYTVNFSVLENAKFGSITLDLSGTVNYLDEESQSQSLSFEKTGGSVTVVCNHTNTEIREEIPATCVSKGYQAGTYCKDCEKYISGGDEIPQLTDHDYEVISHNDSGHTLKCKDCGDETTENHDWNEGEITKEATHLEKGIKTYTCKVCNHTKTEEIEKTTEHTFKNWTCVDEYQHSGTCECGETSTEDHTWDDGVVTKEATHTEVGIKTYTCTKCSATKTEQIEKTTEHNYKNWTSISDAEHTGTCECGETSTEDHTWNDGVVTKEASHTEAGVKTYTCTKCGATKTEEISKLTNHEYGQWEPEDEVFHIRKCVCGEEEQEYHTWGDGTVLKSPTHTEAGSMSYTCTICGYTKTVDIPAKADDHTYGNWQQLKEDDYLYEYKDTWHAKYCECGAALTEAHDWNSGEFVSYPDCIHEGTVRYTCKKCGATKIEFISKTGVHQYGDWIVDENASCSKEGVRHRECEICGEVETQAIPIISDNHHCEWVVEEEATCIKEGRRVKKCVDCGEILDSEVIPITDHTYGEWVVDKEATCSEEGVKHTVCPVCGDIVYGTIPKIDHVGGDWEVIEKPTCSREGVEGRRCKDCGEIIETRSIEKTSHSFENGKCIYCGYSALKVTNTSSYSNCSANFNNANIESSLTNTEIAAMQNGSMCNVTFSVSDITSSVSSKEAKLIKKALTNKMAVASYLDLSVNLTVNGSTREIHELSGTVFVTIEIPSSLLAENRTYSVIRIHDGKAEVIECIKNGSTISFETDEFSTYALCYTQVKEPIVFNPMVLVYIFGGIAGVGLLAFAVYIVIKKSQTGLHPLQ